MSEDQVALLREIRDNQREALAMQREALATQREQSTVYKTHIERWTRLTRLITRLLIPLLLVAMLAIAWPYFRYLWWWISQ